MMSPTDKDRRAALLRSYGADPDRWPDADRALGQTAKTDTDPTLREAASLDALLALDTAPAPSAALMGRILDDAPRPASSIWRLVWPAGPRWAPAAALSVALLAGLGTGAIVPGAGLTTDQSSDTLEMAYAEEIDSLVSGTGYYFVEGELP